MRKIHSPICDMRHALAAAIIAVFGFIGQTHAAATLLPPAESCFQATTGTTGMVGTLGTITGGSGGTAGTYAGVALTGGVGTGATANITVAGGAVTAVTILNPGTQYAVADVLSAASGSIGSVSGFSVPVASVAINSSLAGGKVYFYIPNTTTFKQTWSNAGQTVQNTNPVILDQNGCGVIYGTGSYRQILQDSLSNTVWDAITTDVSANNNTFWAGLAGGTPNVITVVDAGFNATDGSIINFTALSTNTSSATLNPSSFSAIPILQDTTAGPVALTAGQIIQNNPISVIFRASDNAFHLLNPPIASASGATAPLCGATGLKITNNSGTPNTIINLTADQIVMQTTAGITINRSNVSLTAINISTGTTTSTANGMDGEPVGTSAWLDIFAIDNGAAPAGLVSLAAGNGAAPTMPSGYTYKCRLGAMRVDGSGLLFRTLQVGSAAVYVVSAAGTNTPNLPIIDSGVQGTFSTTAPVYKSVTVSGTGNVVFPNTAASIKVVLDNFGVAGTTANVILAQNNTVKGPASGNPGLGPVGFLLNGTGQIQNVEILLESLAIFWASDATGGTILGYGWKDKVNAN